MRIITSIVTHDGHFHADEVFGIALLRYVGYQCDIIRTRDPKILEESIANPNICVLDVGGQYDPEMLNFDHYQDKCLPSAVGLIWGYLKDRTLNEIQSKYLGQFINSIDAVDTNRDNIYQTIKTLPLGFRNTSELIGAFNRNVFDPNTQDYWFEKALDFAIVILKNEIHLAKEKAADEKAYDGRTILSPTVAMFESPNIIWKEKQDHLWGIFPHASGYKLESIDSSIITVPETVTEAKGFKFRHANGFMCIFETLPDAIDFARTL